MPQTNKKFKIEYVDNGGALLIQKYRANQLKATEFNKENSPYMLLILDGWGVAPPWGGNAIAQAQTPNFNYLWQNFPSTTLAASGKYVGLPEGSAGNSEAGHLNIGAGRLVFQDETIIDKEIATGEFFKKDLLIRTFEHAKYNNSTIHLMGMLSESGVHSHINHLFALIDFAEKNNYKNIKVHLFSDGRDSSPMSGIEMVDKVERYLAHKKIGSIASVMGRFYAMDRDNRWGRTARAYNALVKGEADYISNARQVFSKSYTKGVTDEFIEPRIIVNEHQEVTNINDNDVVVLFNFRPDRVRQLTMAFIADKVIEMPDRKKLNNIKFLSFTMYEQHYEKMSIEHIFSPDKVYTPLARVLSENNLKQLHIAETEKYAHVTYFFNGGTDKPYPNEEWKVVNSPKVKTYNLTPHMSAQAIATHIIKSINENKYDFYIVNFANPDMVGHTGNLKAAVQAVNFTDHCLGVIAKKIIEKNGTLAICADHGNAEQMVNPATGQGDTEHTTNPVPFIVARKDLNKKKHKLIEGRLCDIAPTLLYLANLSIPEEMTSSNLLFKEML